ncbi:MAG: hypothetical protein C0495_08485 [Acinetobacter sp.]|jgi:uncharacterized membrane protein YqjE|nr:hypothetical protein [Acinetobacter sp.]
MLKTALKVAVFLFLRSRAKNARAGTVDSLGAVKENMAHMAEMRAAIFKQNFIHELKRIGTSIIGFLFMIVAAISSGIIGLLWIFALAWTSPDRNVILTIALILPLLIGVGIYLYLRNSWKKEHLFEKTLLQIETDWRLFRHGVKQATEEITH